MPGKKKGGKPAPKPSGDGPLLRDCGDCGEAKARDAFSAGMWKKAPRTCKACVEAEDALLAPAADKLAQEKAEERRRKEAAAEEHRLKMEQAMAQDPEKARERRLKAAKEAVFGRAAQPGAPPLPAEKVLATVDAAAAREFAELFGLSEAVSQRDEDGLFAALLAHCKTEMLNVTGSERALSQPYLNCLTQDELEGIAFELDIPQDDIEASDRPGLTAAVRAAARAKGNVRTCALCEKALKKESFNQSQWKKTSGSKCRLCIANEEYERIMFGDGSGGYGYEEEEDVYTAQADLYETLGVDSNASQDELKQAYRKMAVKYHPDRWASAEPDVRSEKEETFKLVTEAYETLSNSAKKGQYDKERSKRMKNKKKREAAAAAAAAAAAQEP
eukprot:Rhum_TRINITY_DN14689_c34_g1::Rhum_TRINITY_DN14689_c34_g1_i1::g.109963::m.109963